jgi:hypothetical protein
MDSRVIVRKDIQAPMPQNAPFQNRGLLVHASSNKEVNSDVA